MKERDEEERQARAASVSAKLMYLLIGGGIGAALALLFAPKSGAELRADVTDAVRGETKYLRQRAGEYDSDEMFINGRRRRSGQAAAAADLGGEETKGDYN